MTGLPSKGNPDQCPIQTSGGRDLNSEILKIWEALSELGKLVPDPNQPQAAPEAERLDRQSTAEWLNTLDAHPLAKQDFIQHIRAEYTTEPERYSLLDLARNASMYYRTLESDKQNYRVIGGNDRIPYALAETSAGCALEAEVTSIQLWPMK